MTCPSPALGRRLTGYGSSSTLSEMDISIATQANRDEQKFPYGQNAQEGAVNLIERYPPRLRQERPPGG